MKLYKLFLPFALLIMVVTLRVSSELTKQTYYIELKEKFSEEIDIISLSKQFLSKIQNTLIDDNEKS